MGRACLKKCVNIVVNLEDRQGLGMENGYIKTSVIHVLMLIGGLGLTIILRKRIGVTSADLFLFILVNLL